MSQGLLIQYFSENMPCHEMKCVPDEELCILRSLQKALKATLDKVVSISDLLTSLRRKILHCFEFYK